MAKTFEGLITLTQVSDGQGGSAVYYVQSSVEQLTKSKEGKFAPDTFFFKLCEKNDDNQKAFDEYKVFISGDDNTRTDISSLCSNVDGIISVKLNDILQSVIENNNSEIKEIMSLTSFSIIGQFYENNEIISQKALTCITDLVDSINVIEVSLSGISAAKNKGVVFDDKGITINNGAFAINYDDESILYFDTVSKQLSVKGKIIATDGSFSGRLESPSGKIGGFTIDANTISFGDDFELKTTANASSLMVSNITIGTGAKIENYINVGKAKLLNPEKNNDLFLESGAIKLYDTGVMNVGEIQIDGESSEISGTNFSITPKAAKFSNVYVSGEIETVVFKKNSVQAAGGAMIFRPSYKIESYDITNKTVIITEDPSDIAGHNILIGGSKGKITTVANSCVKNEEEENVKDEWTITLQDDWNLENYGEPITLVDLGYGDEVLIGINAGEAEVLDKILPKGLTITTLNNKTPNLFLGDLSSLGENKKGISGYGLYSDNVYLNGSLVTQAGTGASATYAGINTLSGVSATIFKNTEIVDESNIIFWAGAAGTDESQIQAAEFQVTEKGGVYAKNAYITNSIMTGGDIRGTNIYGTNIYGANLYGHNGTGSSALNIFDTSNGIQFWAKDKINYVFSINTDGFCFSNNSKFIELSGNSAIFKSGAMIFSNDGMSLTQVTGDSSSVSGELNLKDEGFDFILGGITKAKFSSGEAVFNTKLRANAEFSIGEKAEYRPVKDNSGTMLGYDLYIS